MHSGCGKQANKQINKYYFKSRAVEISLVKCSITKRTPKWPQSNACGHKKPPEILSQVLYLGGVQENWEKGAEPQYLLLPHFASSIEGLLSVSCSEGPRLGTGRPTGDAQQPSPGEASTIASQVLLPMSSQGS